MAVRGLGKGLGALLGESRDEQNFRNGQVAMVNLQAIAPNSFQPRKIFSEEALEELSSSIQSQGVLQPILVRVGKIDGSYELIAGERRWRAAKLAGLTEIPAIIHEVSDRESLALALIENVQREDLNAIEQAQALYQLQAEFQATQNDLAERTGLSRSHIANLLRLLQLPEQVRQDILDNAYTAGHGRALMVITDPESQELLRVKIIKENLSVRACESYASYWKKHGCFPFAANMEKARPPQNIINEVLQKYEEQLRRETGVKKVRIRGSERKGTMTIAYASSEEFSIILRKLGVSPE